LNLTIRSAGTRPRSYLDALCPGPLADLDGVRTPRWAAAAAANWLAGGLVANLFDRQQMQPEPASVPGPDNDLADKLDHFVRRAAADPAARLYAFGQRWGPEAGIPDKIFGFRPGNGVHDIHMNQGNSQRFRQDDGLWQDGGLLLHYPAQDQWVGIFLAFQSQAWHTDDQTGHAIAEQPETDHIVRIVATLVNPPGLRQRPRRSRCSTPARTRST
jgi:uncharacterized protein YukJ